MDEAYIEFSDTTSFVNQINQYKNLIVLRTLSKAFGLAGVHLGFCSCRQQLIFELDGLFLLTVCQT